MKIIAAFLSLLLMSFIGCTTRGFPAIYGIANLDRVDAHLWRGAQPNFEGLVYLKQQGVQSVINLREPSDTWPNEMNACHELGLLYINVPLSGTAKPSAQKVDRILKFIRTLPGPVMVHCQHGAERTGSICAAYRIRSGWSNADAFREAKMYGLSAFATPMREFILGFK